jgi:type IV pilus assembly protein PilW
MSAKMSTLNNSRQGFTLIELVVAIAIASIVMAAIYTLFISQQRTQVNEQVAVDMQQTLRAAVFLIKRDIRMAGYDPTLIWGIDGVDNDADTNVDEADEQQNDRELDEIDNDGDGNTDAADVNGESLGITSAGPHHIQLIMDLNGDRIFQASEIISYRFAKKYDSDVDGLADLSQGGAAPLGRAHGAGSPQALAEDIQAVAFAYAYDFDAGAAVDSLNGDLDTSPGNHIIWAYDSDGDQLLDRILDTNDDGIIDENDASGGSDLIGMGWEATYVPVSRIRAVQLWLLARSRNPIRGYSDTATYVVGDKHIDARDSNRDGFIDNGDQTDNFKRRLLTATVKCRNLGL